MRYKLIKEYPGSPKVGTIVIQESHGPNKHYLIEDTKYHVISRDYIDEQPEYWQLIEETAEEEANELGFKIGDITWGSKPLRHSNFKYKYYGEIESFFINAQGKLSAIFTNRNDVRLSDLTNKVAIHCPTEKDTKFIEGRLNRTYKRHYEFVSINKDFACTDYKFYSHEVDLVISIDEYMRAIGKEPLFYTEDFKDGSFPEKGCYNCELLNLCVENRFEVENCWQGELKGEPIYEGDKCWRINPNSLMNTFEECYDEWTYNANRPNVKFFSNKNNAKTYYNKLKWEGKLKFKVGDVVTGKEQLHCIKSKIKSINYLEELYKDVEGQAIYFATLNLFELYKEPKFDIGKWYKHKKYNIYSIYGIYGNASNYVGFTNDTWSNRAANKHNFENGSFIKANMDKVKELLLAEAKRRYPVRTVFKVAHRDDVICKVVSHKRHKDTFVQTDELHINFVADTLMTEDGDDDTTTASVYHGGKWAEVVEPKFTTADGVDKYEGDDEYYVVNLYAYNILTDKVDNYSNYKWDKNGSNKDGNKVFHCLETAQQYLAEQIAKKRGIEVGNKLFDSKTKRLIGTGGVKHIAYFTDSIQELTIPNAPYNYRSNEVLTLSELAKEEGLEIGTRIPGELICEWIEYNRNDKDKIVFKNEPNTTITDFVMGYNDPKFVIENGRWLNIIGFREFRSKWEFNKFNELKKLLNSNYDFKFNLHY